MEFKSLVTLLEDPDELVYDALEMDILGRGVEIVPVLEKAWQKSLNEQLHERVEHLIETIRFSDVISITKDWANSNNKDLLGGAFILAKYQYPNLTLKRLKDKLALLMEDLKEEMVQDITNMEKIRIINHIFYDVHKFAPNTENLYDPQNSFINQVLDLKKGNTVSLGIIYTILAQQLNLPVYGVNLPHNYILAFLDKPIDPERTGNYSYNVLFYINPFNNGAILGKKEIDEYLIQQNVEKKISHYIPCTTLDSINRLLQTLISSYENLGYSPKVNDLNMMESILMGI